MYRLLGRLEQSALADLYQAVEGEAPRVVKLFHLKTTDADYARAVAEQSRKLSAVSSPGIARIVEVGLVQGRLAVVREDVGRYPLGLVLRRLSTREVHLPPLVALSLVLELLTLLDQVHAAGVVHGALTPGNVHLSDDGRLGVSEFGALAALQASVPLRRAFVDRGRSSYRAPEGVAGEPAVALDVYAAGAIAYELITLREAALGRSTVSSRAERLPPPSRLVRRLPGRVDPAIMRALEASPSRRYRSCGDFAEVLREVLVSQGGLAGPAEVRKFVGELFPNEVQLNQLGPVPFEAPFTLEDAAGLGFLEQGPSEAEDRAPFSKGRVEAGTPTVDGLEVFTLQDAVAQTQDDTAETPSWEAPAGEAAPVTEETPASDGDAVRRRVRAVEDFSPSGKARGPRIAQRAKSVAKTIMTFVVPIHRDSEAREGEANRLDYERLRRRALLRARLYALLGVVILVAVVLGLIAGWYRPTPKLKAAVAPECYAAPPGKAGLLSVTSSRSLRVEIDGQPICGSLKKVAIEPGSRTVRVIDTLSLQEYVATTRFLPGKLVKLTPTFQ